MTFVFAARCRDGVVAAGDTRTIGGYDFVFNNIQNKVQSIDERSVVGFAGNQYLGQRFIDNVKDLAEGKPRTLLELVRDAEKCLFDFWWEYAKARGEREAYKESEEEVKLEILLVSLDESKAGMAKIYYLEQNTPPSSMDDFGSIGYGANTGRGAIPVLWDNSLSIQQAWPLAVAVMKVVGSQHYGVGGIPDIYLVKDKTGASKVPIAKVKQVYESQQISEAIKGIPGYVLHTLSSLKTEQKQVKL
jgi:20S proteasome alpha/beta subunit